jgi:hypothetical protein
MHQDGEGFNVVLQALPINGKIVLRPPKSDDESHQSGGEQQRSVRLARPNASRQSRS